MHKSPKERINSLAEGYLLSSAIHAAAELGIADLLWTKSEQSIDELASTLKVDSRSLFRLLRYLVSYQIFSQNSNSTFSLNPEASYLADEHPESIRHALLVTSGHRWNALGAIKQAIVTGKPAFDVLYEKTYYQYLAKDPEAAERFNAHMTTYTQEEDKLIAPFLPISDARTLIDIGGGQGQFLNEILSNFSHVYGILFDLENAFSQLRINQSQDRWKTQSGDFFESVPRDADVYVLKRVLHNWSDEDCLRILSNIHHAMKKGSKILIIEGIVPENNLQDSAKDADLFLMCLFAGSERTENEFHKLANQAGLQITQILTTPTFLSIIELKAI